ncbi:MAG TPA: MMPL family transporter [Patescibacteria group bacterium]|nr:MMPL family transporter [Patescibacteria group bacterium]
MVPILSGALPKITDVVKSNNSDFLPKSSQSSKAVALEESFQSKDTISQATIVISRSGGLNQSDAKALTAMVQAVTNTTGVASVRDSGTSKDGEAHLYTVNLGSKAEGPAALTVAKDIRQAISQNKPQGAEGHMSGAFAQAVDASTSNNSGKNNTTLFTIIFILVLLFVVFRSVLAPLVTFIPAGLALALSQPLIAKTTEWGVQVSFITEILLVVLILGAGTDYGLFLVFRVREGLRKGLATKEAVIQAVTRVGESITFSAATVVAALLSLLLASFGIYRGLGPALAIGLVVMLLIALTFLPALLAILGRAVFWPSGTNKYEEKIGLWGRLADRVIKRPVAMIIVGVLLFGGLSLGIIGYKTAGFASGNVSATTDSAKGDAVIAQHFSASRTASQFVILHFSDSVWSSQKLLDKVEQAQQALAVQPEFKAVGGPFNATGLGLTAAQLYALHQINPQHPAFLATSQFISSDGKTVQFFTTPAEGKSGSVAVVNATPAIRQATTKVGNSVSADQAQVYSADAMTYDINKIANSDLKKIVPTVLVIIALLLALLLRSAVAPWYLIATVGLSYLASLGFASLVFLHILGQDGLNFVVPFMLFIFCMALGEDYNILVMSRIREEAHTEPTLNAAVTKAVGITGTTVTSAGLLLAGSFGVLGLVGGAQVEQIGYAIAFGILLDTFFVRTLLVPSIVALIGRWNWWPSQLSKANFQRPSGG